METGKELALYESDIIRPESVPGGSLIYSNKDTFRPAAGCYLWRHSAGNFTHVGDGPRGWVTQLRLSADGSSIVIPGMSNAALVDLTAPQRLLALMPFEGKLRASSIQSNQVTLLNSVGKLFISAAPE